MRSDGASEAAVRSVIRALDLLDLLGQSQAGLGLTQISEQTGLNSSTVHRLLSTLAMRGYVRQDAGSKRYLLGPQSLHLSQTALSHFDIRNEALGPLRKLAMEARELANLALLADREAIYIAQAPADRGVQMFTSLGARVPLHCSGVGKAMLAFMPEAEAERLLQAASLPAFTVNTITNALRLQQELGLIRQAGYALDNEERELGVRCVAAPVFAADGRVTAAVSISGPSGRVTPERQDELSELVVAASREISERLGYRAPVSG
jgi:IclR family acetate operon transcriptional repressor